MRVRASLANEQPMQASKWLDVQALLDADEMAQLLNDLDSPHLFLTGCVCRVGQGWLTKPAFLEAYAKYVSILQQGLLPDEQEFRALFSAVLTVTPDVIYAIPIAGGREILRVAKPAVQMQFHRLGFSKVDNKFHPMAFGTQSILWGIQFSYPQLYRDLNTDEVFTVNESDAFPNTALFRALQRWMRPHTIPTPFIVNEQRINVPIRLGKKCLNWINNHPQLKKLGLAVQS